MQNHPAHPLSEPPKNLRFLCMNISICMCDVCAYVFACFFLQEFSPAFLLSVWQLILAFIHIARTLTLGATGDMPA